MMIRLVVTLIIPFSKVRVNSFVVDETSESGLNCLTDFSIFELRSILRLLGLEFSAIYKKKLFGGQIIIFGSQLIIFGGKLLYLGAKLLYLAAKSLYSSIVSYLVAKLLYLVALLESCPSFQQIGCPFLITTVKCHVNACEEKPKGILSEKSTFLS